jgi:hypothetical protein
MLAATADIVSAARKAFGAPANEPPAAVATAVRTPLPRVMCLYLYVTTHTDAHARMDTHAFTYVEDR